VSPEISNLCRSRWQLPEDIDVCEIGLEGGEALGNVLASLNGASTPSLSKEDPKIVSTTQQNHPQAQCRLDTYKRGALCGVSETIDFSYTDHKKGACLTSDLQRPLCWYKPNYTTEPNPDPNPDPEPSDIPPTPTLGSHSSGIMFTYESECNEILFEVKKNKFTTANDTKEDKRSYLGIWNDVGSDSFLVPNRYFRKGTNYTRYFCYDRGVVGKASDAVKFKRK
jgi:hypothetical protein